jgi:uncharacterized LabA/DUF88 family protein
MKKETILLIDGENFRKIVNSYFLNKYKKEFSLLKFDFKKFFDYVLKNNKPTRKIIYFSKIKFYPETAEKSNQLIKRQRKLRNILINNGFEFCIAGNVRLQKINNKIIFREKGVDVKLAVDIVKFSLIDKVDQLIICSSDSDIQPAIKEARKSNTKLIYLGFEINPNKGLIYTTDKSIIVKNKTILNFYK